MKKFLLTISVISMLLIGAITANAAVKWESKDGKTFCTLTYKNDGATQMFVIGTFTENWKEPGWPMEKNAEGLWEITFEMPRAKEFYKFFNPDLDGDKYIEDPEAPDTIANPFGSKNGILRKPKDLGVSGGAAASNEPEEEEYPQVNFGMWSRNTYNVWVKTQLSRKAQYTEDGKFDMDGTEAASAEGGIVEQVKRTGFAVSDVDLTHRWEGENGTTQGNATRIWLDQTRLRSSSTYKVHGKVFKHMVLDTEVNFNFIVDTGYDDYWKASTAEGRIAAQNKIQRDAASQYMGLLWGPFSKNGAWGRWVGEYTGTWDSTMAGDNNVIWIDQIVISFPFDDFEFKAGIMGNNAAQSKDPMALLSGKRTGNKEDIGTNMEWYIHPTKVKNLNFLIGLAHTWRDSGLEKGQGEVWWTTNRVDGNDRKYITYFNFDYEISIAQFGLAWYWNSWSPS
ncbi:MAG: glycogen-binding domain-containing protein, partial [Spirochaetales bacterium]|nr:glycogen-binding domain-containing protein [Spirochaetales bacterium]